MRLTLEDIEGMQSNVLTVQQAAAFLCMDPQTIRDQAERDIRSLGFPICKAGHSWKIPRAGFINWCKGFQPVLLFSDESYVKQAVEYVVGNEKE